MTVTRQRHCLQQCYSMRVEETAQDFISGALTLHCYSVGGCASLSRSQCHFADNRKNYTIMHGKKRPTSHNSSSLSCPKSKVVIHPRRKSQLCLQQPPPTHTPPTGNKRLPEEKTVSAANTSFLSTEIYQWWCLTKGITFQNPPPPKKKRRKLRNMLNLCTFYHEDEPCWAVWRPVSPSQSL